MERIIWPGESECRDFCFGENTARLRCSADGPCAVLTISLPYRAAFGGGERFDAVNLKGHTIDNIVEEKFCSQGGKTYCPMPFFFTDSGFGLYVDTGAATRFAFGQDICVTMPAGAETVLFAGAPGQIIADFMRLFGPAKLPPRWAFMPWISANRWDTQEKAEAQIALLEKYDFPAGVLVLEAWSDEATFYIWNGAQYAPREGGDFCYEDFTFPHNGPWPNPSALVEKLHAAGLRLLLWQIPVYKKQGPEETVNAQNELDRAQAATQKLCVQSADGAPYTIPPGNWFGGSMIPDFTNPATRAQWFARRKYLLDMGVDGFKTDGGEFIYREDLCFADGTPGAEMKNRYAQSYTAAYTGFLPEDTVLFSRAGGAGQHTTPMLWAGDQQSTFEELRAQLRAGLSAAMSGIPFWGFDIGGFAGPLPSPELYLRATQTACFCPVMQWHSEPDGGQFREVMETRLCNNERSPWNIARDSSDPDYLDKLRFYHKLRAKLLPYIYAQAQQCVAENRPLIYPLAYRWPEDAQTHGIENQFMLGSDYLVAPVLQQGTTQREVYLPGGSWREYFSGVNYAGGQTVVIQSGWHIPLFKVNA